MYRLIAVVFLYPTHQLLISWWLESAGKNDSQPEEAIVLVLWQDKSASIEEGDKSSLSISILVSFMEVQSQNNRAQINSETQA